MALDGNTMISLVINLDKTNIILSALGSQPYDQVSKLITDIQEQATTQLRQLAELEKQESTE
jgi:hypothetical protein